MVVRVMWCHMTGPKSHQKGTYGFESVNIGSAATIVLSLTEESVLILEFVCVSRIPQYDRRRKQRHAQ